MIPGPPELLPGRPDAVFDLQTDEGAALVGARWRYSDARVEEIDFVALAGPGAADPLGPGDVPNRTCDVVPQRLPPTTTTPAGVSSRPPRRWTGSRTGASASTGTGRRSRSPSGSATSTRPARRWCSRSWSTTTRRSGRTASCRSRSATR